MLQNGGFMVFHRLFIGFAVNHKTQFVMKNEIHIGGKALPFLTKKQNSLPNFFYGKYVVVKKKRTHVLILHPVAQNVQYEDLRNAIKEEGDVVSMGFVAFEPKTDKGPILTFEQQRSSRFSVFSSNSLSKSKFLSIIRGKSYSRHIGVSIKFSGF